MTAPHLLPQHRKHLVLTALFLLASLPLAHADLLRGQVTQTGTEKPIAGATIKLYSDPAGDPDFTLVSDILGLYETPDPVSTTEYEARVSHPGYLPDTSTFTMSSNPQVEDFELTPNTAGGTPDGGLEIHIQVVGATTQLELVSCPVSWTRYEAVSGGPALESDDLLTSEDGNLVMRGMKTGFYEFHVNTGDDALPGWHSVSGVVTHTSTLAQRYEVTKSAALNVQLKPVEGSLTFHVKGYDFIKDTPLDEDLGGILVEITAVDPNDPDRELMPPISDVTDDDSPIDSSAGVVRFGSGKVTFEKLPPVAYRVRVKEIGYFEYEDIIFPEDGLLADPDDPIILAPEENLLLVTPVFAGYKSNNALPFDEPDGIKGLGLEVNLIGLDGTPTEGIQRRNFVKETPPFDKGLADFSEPYFDFTEDPPMHVMPGPSYLKPGRYKVIISGYTEERVDWDHPAGSSFDNRVSLGVQHEEIVEIDPVGPVFFGFSGDVIEYPVEIPIQPLTLTGRLFKADGCDAVNGDPVYEPLATTPIEFVQPHGLGVLMSVPPFTTTTDAHGNYSIELPPGIFAIKVTAPGYTGGRIERTTVYSADPFRIGETTSNNALLNDRWPFADPWPDALGNTDKVLHYLNGNGVAINGHDVTTLDLFLHKNIISVDAQVEEELGPSTTRVVTLNKDTGSGFVTYPNSRLLNGAAKLRLDETGGAMLMADLVRNRPIEDAAGPLSYLLRSRWASVPPGTYTPTLPHTGYDVISVLGGTVWYPDFPSPGGVPSAATATLLGTLADFERAPRPLDCLLRSLRVQEKSEAHGITFKKYNSETELYETVGTGPTAVFIQVTGGGPSGQKGYFMGDDLPAAEGFVWFRDSGKDYWKIAHGDTLKFDGPSGMDTPYTALPDLKYDLMVHTLSIEDDNEEVGTVIVSLADKPDQTTGATGTTFTAVSGSGRAIVKAGQNWRNQPQNAHLLPRFVSATDTKVTLEQDLYVERGIEVRIHLTHSETDIAIADVPVTIYNRYGAWQRAVKTDSEGKVKVMGLPGFQDYFLDIQFPGFKHVRKSYRTSALDDDEGQKFYNAAITLVPMKQPSIETETFPFNRRGTFLPGVTRSGDHSSFELFSAEDDLTADWSLLITPSMVSYTLENFDSPSGGTGGTRDVSYVDLPRNVYLLDERTFKEIGGQGKEDSVSFGLPEDTDPHLMRAFLRNLTTKRFGKKNSRVFAQITRLSSPETPTTTAMGKLKVWELPSGTFKPVFVVESTSGAFETFRVPLDGDTLTGIPIPSWLGFAFNIMGFAAGVSATQEELAKYVPESDLIPFPDFSASISTTPPMDGKSYIDYVYELKVGAEIGQQGPQKGIAKLLPGKVGAQVEGSAKIMADGKDGTIALSLSGMATGTYESGKPWTPALVKSLNPQVKVKGKRSITTTLSEAYGPARPYNYRLSARRTADLELNTSVNLVPVTSKIPYAGPVILGLAKVGSLRNTGTFDAHFHTSTLDCFETIDPDPPSIIPGTAGPKLDQDPRNRRRSFLGGNWCGSDANKTKYTMTATVGMELGLYTPPSIVGRFGLEGRGEASLKDWTVITNKFGDWPPIKRISGSINLGVSAKVITPVKNWGVSRSWEALKFDAQYGTETVVQFISMESIDFTESIASVGSPSVLSGMAPQLIKNVSALSWFDVGPSDPDIMLYPSYNSGTGKVDLLLAKRGAGLLWTLGSTVASIDEMGPNTILRLADGRLLVVWMQPPGTPTADPFAPMDVKYVLGNATDTVFSAPATLVAAPAGLTSLELHNSGGTIALFTVLQSGGYSATKHDLFAYTFDSSTDTWSSAIPLDSVPLGYKELAILSSGASGPAEFGIASLDAGDVLSFARWDGVAASPTPTVLASDIAGGLAGHLSATGHTLIVANDDGDLLRLDRATGVGMTFGPAVTLATGLAPAESKLLPRPSGGFLYGYTTPSAGGTEIQALAFLADNSLVGTGPIEITNNEVGCYKELRMVSPLSGVYHIYARFSGSTNHEIRVFEITEALSLDSNNSDSDDLNDLFELRLIDQNEADGLAMVSDVLGSDDFDGDGFSNAEEEAGDSSPVSAISLPPYDSAITAWLSARDLPTNSDLSLDDDFNGWSLGEEFAFGIEPGDAPGTRYPVLEMNGDDFRYRYTRRAGVGYTLQSGDSKLAGVWTDIVPISTTVLSTNPDGTENVAVDFTFSGAPGFIRVEADLTP